MISRVAENCFWLARYLERADNIARLLRVNRAFVLDVKLPPAQRWHPVIVVSGEQERFPTLYPEDAISDGNAVQQYLTWDERNPVSIYCSVAWARENARTIRETISLEMWEAINDMWHWLSDGSGRASYESDRDGFYGELSFRSAALRGVRRDTMLREEPSEFIRLGTVLERANGTARLVDVKHHMLESARAEVSDSVRQIVEAAHCGALLRSCSASEPYLKRVRRTPRHRRVVRFLLKEPALPRSVAYCLGEAEACLGTIRGLSSDEIGQRSVEAIGRLKTRLIEASFDDDFAPVHAELTHIVDSVAEICQAVHDDYFDPQLVNGAA